VKPPADSYGTASHRLVTNDGPAPADAWVRAENTVLETLLSAGLSVHVAVAAKLLDRAAPGVYDAFAERDSPGQTPLSTSNPVVELTPADADLPTDVLGVPTDEPVPTWREHGVDQVVAVDTEADSWLYYSVPRKPAVRAMDEPGRSLRAEIREVVAAVPCTALFPHGALASWEVADVRVELTVEGLWLGRADGTTRWYPHEQLEGVVVDEHDCELLLSWPTHREKATSSLGRLLRGLVDRVSESPPRLLHPPDAETLSTAATAYELVSDRLCYDFEVRRHGADEPVGVVGRVR
jgi:hypothetical protein